MTRTAAADAYIREVTKRLQVEREIAGADELNSFTRHEAKGARDALTKVLAELPMVLADIENEAWSAHEHERVMRETSYIDALLDNAA